MWLAELRLRDFRNYAATDLAFEAGITVLVGANAQGKSNLLESVYTAALGRSPRASADVELVRFGQDRAYVRAEVRDPRADVLEIAVDRTTGEKRMKVNGVVVQRGQLLGRMAIVLAGPLDGDVIRGAAGARRRLLDAALSQASPSYFFALTRYLRVVRQRNRLLGEGAGGAALEPWDEQLVALGATLVERRRGFVRALAARAAKRHARVSDGSEGLDVTYSSTADDPGGPAPVSAGPGDGREAAALARALARHRAEEYRRRTSLVGPHRDDLRIGVNGVDLRAFGSRGQQHTAALSLRLGEAEILRDELGTWPVLLLDDVLADLDPARQIMLLREIEGPQVLLTHTVPPPAAGVALRMFMVRGGAIEAGTDVHA
ncbi:MAG TPA: DNA replication and repair protein RecF [bacterium]|nr:DNA replication and repair protein RecF [bacterium]